MTDEFDSGDVTPGDVLYAADGDPVGVVAGFTDAGFEVETAGEDGRLPDGVDPEKPGGAFGEGYLAWRCTECGEMGDLEGGMPAECPNCGAAKRALYRTRED